MFEIGQTVKAKEDIDQEADEYAPRQRFARKGELLKITDTKHMFNGFDYYVESLNNDVGNFGVSADEIEAT